MNIDYKAIGERIRNERRSKGITQQQFGDSIGISASFVGHIERGSRIASIETLVSIADCLGVSIDYLLGRRHTALVNDLPASLTDEQRMVAYAAIDGIMTALAKK